MKIALLALLFSSSSSILAQDISLKGIPQIQVRVNLVEGQGTGACVDADSLAKLYGETKGPIQTETELRLREAGMRIGSSAPILAIDISTCPGLVSVTTRLVEWVSSSRGQNGLAVTWMFGYQMGDSTGLKIREQIRDQVSKFVNLWLADNGK